MIHKSGFYPFRRGQDSADNFMDYEKLVYYKQFGFSASGGVA